MRYKIKLKQERSVKSSSMTSSESKEWYQQLRHEGWRKKKQINKICDENKKNNIKFAWQKTTRDVYKMVKLTREFHQNLAKIVICFVRGNIYKGKMEWIVLAGTYT